MGWGEREGSQQISSSARPGNFLDFLRTFRKFPGNSVIVPSLDRKRFPVWAYAELPYRAWENCSGQCKGLFQAQKRKITMTFKENINFCHSAPQHSPCPLTSSAVTHAQPDNDYFGTFLFCGGGVAHWFFSATVDTNFRSRVQISARYSRVLFAEYQR